MIAANQLFFDTISRLRINDAAIDLTATIDNAVFFDKMLIFGENVIGIFLRFVCAEFAAQIFVRHIDNQLIGRIGWIVKAVIQIVVGNGRADPERDVPVPNGICRLKSGNKSRPSW